jgi:hypothetical protein
VPGTLCGSCSFCRPHSRWARLILVVVESSRESPRQRWVERWSARGKKKGRAKTNHDSRSRHTTWASYFLGHPFVPPPLILHRSEGIGTISFGEGKGAEAARDRRCWAVVPSGVSPRLGAVRGSGGCCPVLSLLLHIIAVAVVAVVRRASRANKEREKSENKPQYLTWLVFVTHLLGLSLLGPSSRVAPSRFLRRTRINRPHPSGEGRGGCV